MGSPIRLSLIRKHTWMGGERRVVGSSILLGVSMGWLLTNGFGMLYGIPVAMVIWAAGTWVAREMYKSDPYSFDIWLRHMKYQKYYAPKAHHRSEFPQVRDFI